MAGNGNHGISDAAATLAGTGAKEEAVSQLKGEARRGDEEAARRRLEALAECKVLAVTDDARQLTKRILETGLIPQRATADAAHIGLATAHGMDFLLTWNCRHIHNAFIEHRLQGVCEALGLSLPTLCTPPELMADYLQA
jgi:hypothetical protein